MTRDGNYNTSIQIKFKISMLESSLCDYSDAYVNVKRYITIDGAVADDAAKQLDQRNYAPFTDCIREINYTKVDNAKVIDVDMLMHNLIEYSDNYSKTSGGLW